jgi:hypothetical protein
MASALLALDPVVVDQSGDLPGSRFDLASLPVDEQWHVYLDPEVLGATDVTTAGFWLIHQVSHLLRHHADRCLTGESGSGEPTSRRTQAQQIWNVAADCEINDDLVAGDATVPANAVTPRCLVSRTPPRPRSTGTFSEEEKRRRTIRKPALRTASATAAVVVMAARGRGMLARPASARPAADWSSAT